MAAAEDLSPGADSPHVPPDFVGVAVVVSAPRAPQGPVDLIGVFQLPEAEADAIDGQPHRALAMVMTSADGSLVGTPYRDRVFFDEDVERAGGQVRGYFRMRLIGGEEAIAAGAHWVSVSLGARLSNTAEIARGGRGGRGP
jgi:hypothetical protein